MVEISKERLSEVLPHENPFRPLKDETGEVDVLLRVRDDLKAVREICQPLLQQNPEQRTQLPSDLENKLTELTKNSRYLADWEEEDLKDAGFLLRDYLLLQLKLGLIGEKEEEKTVFPPGLPKWLKGLRDADALRPVVALTRDGWDWTRAFWDDLIPDKARLEKFTNADYSEWLKLYYDLGFDIGADRPSVDIRVEKTDFIYETRHRWGQLAMLVASLPPQIRDDIDLRTIINWHWGNREYPKPFLEVKLDTLAKALSDEGEGQKQPDALDVLRRYFVGWRLLILEEGGTTAKPENTTGRGQIPEDAIKANRRYITTRTIESLWIAKELKTGLPKDMRVPDWVSAWVKINAASVQEAVGRKRVKGRTGTHRLTQGMIKLAVLEGMERNPFYINEKDIPLMLVLIRNPNKMEDWFDKNGLPKAEFLNLVFDSLWWDSKGTKDVALSEATLKQIVRHWRAKDWENLDWTNGAFREQRGLFSQDQWAVVEKAFDLRATKKTDTS
ncbi:hypothetical protein A3F62_02845 [Candidatus Woesebacteria bacterium RIFCSPHIGHO2_12_FULL_44_11]|uniref:Uncharacterized protein n=1 Tax=Candidatus Woesebacteria bacterium RIFCSPLOWO2_01_FULL_44_14 TaxID=1802525 RepID=A0A1F8C1H7_9BACT|nr:MAG: hypothetical protein A3F62_02845 [Candidatus Woesebacteria bacterium RIFCSPHIGHO2_12_FULL_44_11]OGM70187.1 MAG: hypothetical protein A2975_03885 [Candidatus Woesebacteria bacterium RIFCSPLOWO2_01_FULL_44_14]